VQIVIANTYHLWRTLGEEKLKNYAGLHQVMQYNGAIMTDSGGFQVFSLGFGREHGVGKIANIFPGETGETHSLRKDENMVRVTEEGVYFKEGGEDLYLDAEKSIAIQEALGADIILAFDECTSPLHDHEYTKAAMERTHRWAGRSIHARKRRGQFLYGIVQGGAFEDLRKASAKFVGSLPFDGFAVGGSLGRTKEDMFQVIKWTTPFLPEDKPRHLLGIGAVVDVFRAVELGIDTFDCVIPTREARHGAVYTHEGRVQITKGRHKGDSSKIDRNCYCPVCEGITPVTRGLLHEFFKTKNPEAARLATLHNVYFFNDLMMKIRWSIKEGRFTEFKKETLARLK
jgi:queuine tRNA-ribosyltransferase/7-cyano-7-deazaguanine tRNA-ribosyltransferase